MSANNNKPLAHYLAIGAFGIAGFVLVWMFNMNATIAKMQNETETLAKHWKLHGWARDEINDIRSNANLPAVRWPELD